MIADWLIEADRCADAGDLAGESLWRLAGLGLKPDVWQELPEGGSVRWTRHPDTGRPQVLDLRRWAGADAPGLFCMAGSAPASNVLPEEGAALLASLADALGRLAGGWRGEAGAWRRQPRPDVSLYTSETGADGRPEIWAGDTPLWVAHCDPRQGDRGPYRLRHVAAGRFVALESAAGNLAGPWHTREEALAALPVGACVIG